MRGYPEIDLFVRRKGDLSAMPCCKCNRTGTCKGCACVKAGLPCTSCLPSRLGSCMNSQQTQTQTAQTPVNALPAAQLSDVPPTIETLLPTEEDSPADGDSYDDLLAPTQPPGVPDATIQKLSCPSPMVEAHFTWGSWEVSSERYINSVKVAYFVLCIGDAAFFLSLLEKLVELLSVRWPGCFDPMQKGHHLSPLLSQQQ